MYVKIYTKIQSFLSPRHNYKHIYKASFPRVTTTNTNSPVIPNVPHS
jgi:hypothetical protein